MNDTQLPQLPPGDDTRGWRRHWRRGMYGSIQDWAGGSKNRVGHMLSECALYFDVVNDVGERLGFGITMVILVHYNGDTSTLQW